jgi:hypothetical protein
VRSRCLTALILALAPCTVSCGQVAAAAADTDTDAIARALQSDPVYVAPAAAGRLSVADRGRIRLAIVRKAIGRIKIAVLPASAADDTGGAGGLANAIDRAIDVPGALIVVAGPAYYAVTSHPGSQAAAAALRRAVARHRSDGLAAQLLDAIDGIAAVDPGPSSDIRAPQQPQQGSPPPKGADAKDFLDDIKDSFLLGVLIVAGAIALPFLLVAGYLVNRARRGHAREEEQQKASEEAARDQLLRLGEGIRSLDIDTSMPGADQAGVADYEQAVAHYDQANELLTGEPTPYRVEQARTVIAAGERAIEAAKQRLG